MSKNFIIALVIIFASTALGFLTAQFESHALDNDQLTQYARNIAENIQQVTLKQSKKLTQLSQSNEIQSFFSEGYDASKANQLAQSKQAEFPESIDLRLLPVDSDQLLDKVSPSLSFAAISMINETIDTGNPSLAEWHFPGQPQENIALVHAVKSNSQPIGIIYLTLKTDTVADALNSAATESMVQVELKQIIKSADPVLLLTGEKTAKKNNPKTSHAVIKPVSGTRWLVFVNPLSGLAVNMDSPILQKLMLPGLGAVILIALLLLRKFMPRRKQKTEAKADKRPPEITEKNEQIQLNETKKTEPKPEEELPFQTDNIDLEVLDEDTMESSMPEQIEEDLVEIDEVEMEFEDTANDPEINIPKSIFRAYDIRGIVDDTLTGEIVYNIGKALGSEAHARGDDTVIVGRDGRLSSPELSQALINGLTESGRDVIDIGMVPTPVLYFATHFFDTQSGIMITGSHNPPNYNGIKMVLAGTTLANEAIQDLRQRILDNNFTTSDSGEPGQSQNADIGSEYIARITGDIPVALSNSFKVVIDAGNGVAGSLGPKLVRALGHDVIEIYCEIDGHFPNHHPDPSQPENLKDLIDTVKSENADLGLAFDGDGDRLGVVDRNGNVIWPDRQMMLFAQDVISRNPGGEIIFDVKCSNHLKRVIEEAGGKATMWKTGHSLIKAKIKESGALLAGEMSGHVFFKERWYGFDDGLYTAARLLEILTEADQEPEEILGALPGGVATPELRLDLPEEQHAAFMATLSEQANFGNGVVGTIDGIRVDFAEAWGLIRPSNTTPCLVMRFEADNDPSLKKIQDLFREQLLKIDPSLNLPF